MTASGGRVRSDIVDGFTLDRGFQVALTAYPEMHRQLDMEALDLQAFDPGALVWRNGKGSVVADPFRMPRATFATATAPIGSLFDKARIAQLRHSVRSVHPSKLLHNDDITTHDALSKFGFSDRIIERFFTPLVGGIQLDPDLGDSRRMFDIIFRMLADGDSVVPAAGMQAISDQLATRLPAGTIRLETPVVSATANRSPSTVVSALNMTQLWSQPRVLPHQHCSVCPTSHPRQSDASTSPLTQRRPRPSSSFSMARVTVRFSTWP